MVQEGKYFETKNSEAERGRHFFFLGEINQVIADLIKRIYIFKSQAEDGETVTNVTDLFFE